jgi:hypothetical protein
VVKRRFASTKKPSSRHRRLPILVFHWIRFRGLAADMVESSNPLVVGGLQMSVLQAAAQVVSCPARSIMTRQATSSQLPARRIPASFSEFVYHELLKSRGSMLIVSNLEALEVYAGIEKLAQVSMSRHLKRDWVAAACERPHLYSGSRGSDGHTRSIIVETARSPQSQRPLCMAACASSSWHDPLTKPPRT